MVLACDDKRGNNLYFKIFCGEKPWVLENIYDNFAFCWFKISKGI